MFQNVHRQWRRPNIKHHGYWGVMYVAERTRTRVYNTGADGDTFTAGFVSRRDYDTIVHVNIAFTEDHFKGATKSTIPLTGISARDRLVLSSSGCRIPGVDCQVTVCSTMQATAIQLFSDVNSLYQTSTVCPRPSDAPRSLFRSQVG